MDVIKYQCSYCNTLFDSTEHCPTCGALSKDAIQINYTQNVKKRVSYRYLFLSYL